MKLFDALKNRKALDTDMKELEELYEESVNRNLKLTADLARSKATIARLRKNTVAKPAKARVLKKAVK